MAPFGEGNSGGGGPRRPASAASPGAPGASGGGGAEGPRPPVVALQDWIAFHRRDVLGVGDAGSSSSLGSSSSGNINVTASSRARYLEDAVRILRSLAGEITIIGARSGEVGDEAPGILHPYFITIDNAVVSFDGSDGTIKTADFVTKSLCIGEREECNDDDNATKEKTFAAMDALGRIAYKMCTLLEGPGLSTFFPAEAGERGGSGEPHADGAAAARSVSNSNHSDVQSNGLSAEGEDDCDSDDGLLEIMGMLRKSARTTTSEDDGGDGSGCAGLTRSMLASGVPFPLCRLVSDLLRGNSSIEGAGFRSERSFSSFEDVLCDLDQMISNPRGFLHASSPDRWKIAFGTKLYGRDGHARAFMDAADRVRCHNRNNRRSQQQKRPPPREGREREVVMVSGHSGAGKSHLVRFGGDRLRGRGWRFLRCKFDRVAHPEPLSIIASAFEDYFASFATPLGHEPGCIEEEMQDMRRRLGNMVSPDGLLVDSLGVLAKHIPSLRLVANVPQSGTSVDLNETLMAEMFGDLLRVLSSGATPVLFFMDDLQWADPLSLSLLMALVRGADHLNLSPAGGGGGKRNRNAGEGEEGGQTMFVGSYRDNEVDDDHPLARVLRKFQSDSLINLTNISLERFDFDTLNLMLSETLLLPVRRVRPLSEIVIQKTDGQPLHVIEFIHSLTADGLLTHSFERGWEWDADSIDICPISDSVAELYAFKLRRLPKDILLGLQILSCFGSQIDQQVLEFVANYDGERSVNIDESIRVVLSEGLVERAAHLVRFSHDMIQKATIESLDPESLVDLLCKLAAALISNASVAGKLTSVLFVAVDLINRVGSDRTTCPRDRAQFAEMNLRAATMAIEVPDFAGAARYSEHGIAFLDDDCWEAQYGLSVRLYETAVLSHFSSLDGDRGVLTKRINTVFEHAKDFTDQFKTCTVFIKVLSMTDLQKAIDASLNALKWLGEPIDLSEVDFSTVYSKLVACKERFAEEKKNQFLSTNRMADCNKVRAMQIMSSLVQYYYQKTDILGAFICCHMIEMTATYGHCEDSVFAAASFAAFLVTILEDISEGHAWGQATLSLMEEYGRNVLTPSVYAAIHGIVFIWRDPMQLQLEPLAQGIRTSFTTGNVEFAVVNTIYYISRSYSIGKGIRVLVEEIEALARQHGNHFGNEDSTDKPVYTPLLQFWLTPLHNALLDLEGRYDSSDGKESAFPLDKVQFVHNNEIIKVALGAGQFSCFHAGLSYETPKAFMIRDMDNALMCTNYFFEHFLSGNMLLKYTEIFNVFYEGLITFYFARQTGEKRYEARGKNALGKMKEWAVHSDWNWKNKLLLVEAEYHNTQKDPGKAVSCYKASIKAAHDHKFTHEEAMGSELAAIFFLENGMLQESCRYFKHSMKCYTKWGAFAVAKRIEDKIDNEFGSELVNGQTDGLDASLASQSTNYDTSKKRHFN